MKLVETLKNYYLAICLVLLALGAGADYASSAIAPTITEFTKVDVAGKTVTGSFVNYPVTYYILRISSGILYTACFSIFVALFVMHRIEEDQVQRNSAQLEKIQRAINEDVFNSLFKTIIPTEIFEAIKSEIIRKGVIRRNATWILDFVELKSGEIGLRQTIGFDLVNLSNTPASEPTKLDVFVAGGNRQGLEQATCTVDNEVIVSFDAANPKAAKGVDFKQEETGRLIIEFALIVPPHGTAHLMTVFRNKYLGSVQDEYFTQTALINADLTATFPEGYEFKLYNSLSSELRMILSERTRHLYRLRGGVLPGQGYVFYLNKMSPQSGAHTPAVTSAGRIEGDKAYDQVPAADV